MDIPGTSNMSSYSQWAHAVECPICYSIYDKPMQMSCGHTLCASCIGQLVEQVRRNPDENNGPQRVNVAMIDQGGAIINGLGGFIDQADDPQQFIDIPRMDPRELQNMRGIIALPPRRSGGTTIKCPECRTQTFVPNDGLPVNYRVQEIVAKVAPMYKDRHLIKHCNQCKEVLAQGIYFNCTQCTENCTKLCSTCIVRSHNGHTMEEVKVLTSKDVQEMKEKIKKSADEAYKALDEVKPRLADIGGSIETETMQKLTEFSKVFDVMVQKFDSTIEEHTTVAELEVEVTKAQNVANLYKGSLTRLNEGLFTAIREAVTKFWDPFEKLGIEIGHVPKQEQPEPEPAPAVEDRNEQQAQELALGEAAAIAAAHAVIQPIRRPNELVMRNARHPHPAVAHFGNVVRQRQRQQRMQQFQGQPQGPQPQPFQQMMQFQQMMMHNIPQGQPPQNQMQVMRGPPVPHPPQVRPMQQIIQHHHHGMPPQMPQGPMGHQHMPMNMFPNPQMQQQQQQAPPQMPQMQQRAPQNHQMQQHQQMMNPQQQQPHPMAPQRQMPPHPQMMHQGHPGMNQQMQQRHPNDPRDFGQVQNQHPQPQRLQFVQRIHPNIAHMVEPLPQMPQMPQVQPVQQQVRQAAPIPDEIPQAPWGHHIAEEIQGEQPPQFPFNDGEMVQEHEEQEAEQEEPEEPGQRLNPEIEAFRVANANLQEYHEMRDRMQAGELPVEEVADEEDQVPADNGEAGIQMNADIVVVADHDFGRFQEMRQEVEAIEVEGFDNIPAAVAGQENGQQHDFIELYDNAEEVEQAAIIAAAQEAQQGNHQGVIIEEIVVEDDEAPVQQAERNPTRRSARREASTEVTPEMRRTTRSSARNAAHHDEPSTSAQSTRSPSPAAVPKRRKVERKPIVEEPEQMDEGSDEVQIDNLNRPPKRRAATSAQGTSSASSSGTSRRPARS